MIRLQEKRDTELSSLRLHPRDDAELCWFWDTAPGEMGMRAQSYERGTVGDVGAAESAWLRQMTAAERWDDVRKELDRMPKRLVRVLQRWCSVQHRPDAALVVAFGPFAGIATLTDAARDIERIAGQKLARVLVAETGADETAAAAAVTRARAGAPHAALLHACALAERGTLEERQAAKAKIARVMAAAECLLARAVREHGQAKTARRSARAPWKEPKSWAA